MRRMATSVTDRWQSPAGNTLRIQNPAYRPAGYPPKSFRFTHPRRGGIFSFPPLTKRKKPYIIKFEDFRRIPHPADRRADTAGLTQPG